MNHPSLKQRYDYIIQTYIDQFCAKHDCEVEYQTGGMYCIGDAYLSPDVIRYDIDNEVEKGKIFEWYWKWVDKQEYPNFENWLKMQGS